MSVISDSQEAMRLICRTIRATGEPMSRLELARAIEPDTIFDLRGVLEEMMKWGMLMTHVTSTQNQTVVLRYALVPGTDCDSL